MISAPSPAKRRCPPRDLENVAEDPTAASPNDIAINAIARKAVFAMSSMAVGIGLMRAFQVCGGSEGLMKQQGLQSAMRFPAVQPPLAMSTTSGRLSCVQKIGAPRCPAIVEMAVTHRSSLAMCLVTRD